MDNASEKEYIIHGPLPLIPVAEGTAGEQIFHALKNFSHLPEALVCGDTQEIVSFSKLLEKSCRVAYRLRECGMGPDSVISILSENSLQYYYPLLASLFLGITVAPINSDYVKNELYHAVNTSKPQIIFCSKKTVDKALELQRNYNLFQKIIVMDVDDTPNGVESLDSFIDEYKDTTNFKPLKFDINETVALILCSSGTTGLPKGAMLTHKNLSVKFEQLSDPILGMMDEPETTVIPIFSMSHIGGLAFNLMFLILGFRTIIMKKFSTDRYLQLIQDYKVQASLVVPPIMTLLAKSPLVEKYDLSSLKEIFSGAAPLSKEIIALVLERLPQVKEVRQGYGLTETASTVTSSPRGGAKIGSTGKLLPFTSAKVIDMSTNQTLGPNQLGELYFKGGLIMKGYANNETETANTVDANGWLRTGDIGYYDDELHFYVVDRLKELIKYKGFQVSPVELEALLLLHPKIKDAAVIGIDDEMAGQLPRALVVKEQNEILTELEVLEYIADRK